MDNVLLDNVLGSRSQVCMDASLHTVKVYCCEWSSARGLACQHRRIAPHRIHVASGECVPHRRVLADAGLGRLQCRRRRELRVHRGRREAAVADRLDLADLLARRRSVEDCSHQDSGVGQSEVQVPKRWLMTRLHAEARELLDWEYQ